MISNTPAPMTTCNTHPDAPHGFDRTASHSLDRYVCTCEGWKPEDDNSKRRSPIINVES
jgi:hypothetical protein